MTGVATRMFPNGLARTFALLATAGALAGLPILPLGAAPAGTGPLPPMDGSSAVSTDLCTLAAHLHSEAEPEAEAGAALRSLAAGEFDEMVLALTRPETMPSPDEPVTSGPGFGCTSADFAALSGAALIEAVATSDYECMRPLFTFDADVATVISQANVNLFAAQITSEAADVAANAARLRQMALYFQIAFYHDYYEASVNYDGATRTAAQGALMAIANSPQFLQDGATLSTLRQQWTTSIDSTDGSVLAVNRFHDLFQRWEANPALASSNVERLTIYGILFTLSRQIGNSAGLGMASPWYSAVPAALVEDLATLAHTTSYNGLTQYLVNNAVYDLGHMSALDPATRALGHERLSQTLDIQAQHSGPWLWAILALEQFFGSMEFDGTPVDGAQIRADLTAIVFPDTHTFESGSLIFRTGLPKATVDLLYDALQEVDSQYFRATAYTAPVAGDMNPDIEMYLYESRADYVAYQTFLFGLSTDNGGIYIEGDGRFYTYERTPQESIYTLEQLLRHEYTHYLNGRYLIQGLFGQGLYQNNRMVWIEEGLAEYMAGATRVSGVLPREALIGQIATDGTDRLTVSQIIAATYFGGFQFYRYAGLFFLFLREQHPEIFVDLLSRIRANDAGQVDALYAQLSADMALQAEYSAFLDAQVADFQAQSAIFAEDVPTARTPVYVVAGNQAALQAACQTVGPNISPSLTVADRRFRYSDTITVNVVAPPALLAAAQRQAIDGAINQQLVTLTPQSLNFSSAVAWFGDFQPNGNQATATYFIEGPYNSSAGPNLHVDPPSLGFGTRFLADGPAPGQTITVTSIGSVPLEITGISLTGTHAGEFTLSGDTGLNVVTPGDDISVQVAFDPSTPGLKEAAVRVSSDASGQPAFDIPLTGTGAIPVVHHVDLSAPASGDGTSWAMAFNTIQEAINAANATDQVWVADGVYGESIVMASGVRLYGGFTGLGGLEEVSLAQRDFQANETVIDAGAVVAGGPADHVVTMDGLINARLDGFTVTGGEASGTGFNPFGGGLWIWQCNDSNTVANCTVTNNTALRYGGGIFLYNSNCVVENCRIIGNSAGEGGGGMDMSYGAPRMTDCVIANNRSDFTGGGISMLLGNPVFDRCRFIGNSAMGQRGGAVFGRLSTEPTFLNCLFSGNTPTGNFGSLRFEEQAAPSLYHCNIVDNEGGGIDLEHTGPTTIVNTVIAGNGIRGLREGFAEDDPAVISSLFHNTPAPDYRDHDTASELTGAAAINALAQASLVVDGNPMFVTGPTGTWTAPPAHDPSLNVSVFTDSAASLTPGALAGRILNPNTAQRRQTLILDNTATTITAAGDTTSFAPPGATYRVMDYHIPDLSPAVDRGTAISASFEAIDIDGDPRPVDIAGQGVDANPLAIHDIGIYEVQLDGPEINVVPMTLNFAARDIDAGPSAPQIVTIHNTGVLPLTFTGQGIRLSGAGQSDFGFAVAPETTPIPAGGSRQVSVHFDPATVGFKPPRLRITTDDATEPAVEVQLTGTGTDQNIVVEPVALTFPARGVNSGPSLPLTLTVRNTGNGALNFTGAGMAITGAQAANFAFADPPMTAPLAGGGQRTVQVVFDPAALGGHSAAVTLTTDDADTPSLQVPLTGTGGVPGPLGTTTEEIVAYLLGQLGNVPGALALFDVNSDGQVDAGDIVSNQ